ncbi:MAG: DUF4118 domain-containing protein [Chthoniobacterales bacterium]
MNRTPLTQGYIAGIVGVAFLTLACWLVTPITGYPAISLIYLLGVLFSGMFLRRGPVLLVAALSALAWNFLFIPPLFTFHIDKVQDGLMFVTCFVVALTIGSLTSRLRAREQAEREREQRATALYLFAQRIAAASVAEAACAAATAHLREMWGLNATVVFGPDAAGPHGDFDSLPIKKYETNFGAIRIKDAELSVAHRDLLRAFADELANLLERDRLMQIAAKAELSHQAERLRKTLLDCVSHELKTPLAAISAASQQLLRAPRAAEDDLARELAGEIHHGSQRLHRVVNNLLDMTRLESGVIELKLEWSEVGDLLQGAIESERDAVAGRRIVRDLPADLPLIMLDHSLIEQAVAKLLANAALYTPPTMPIEVTARVKDENLSLSIADRGPGLPLGATDKVFEKFYRANGNGTGGLGLGLSIARGFVEAHGGRLVAENREGGGARFQISVPVRVADPGSLETDS